MLPKQHFLFGAIFAGVLLLLFPRIGLIGFFLILASSVLIDVDHYLYYVYKKRDLSLKNAHNWFIRRLKKFLLLSREKRNKFYTGIFFLHGVEVLIILFFLSFILKYFLYILIGFAFHIILDLVFQTIYIDRIHKVSVIYDYFKFRKLEFI
jgi:hypothetical protein